MIPALFALVIAAGPVNTSLPMVAGAVRAGSTVTAQPGSWSGNGTVSFDYRWRVCADAAATNCHDAGTGPTLRVPAEPGFLVLRVAATDADGSSSADSKPHPIAPAGSPGGGGGTSKPPTITLIGPRAVVHHTYVDVVVRVTNDASVTIAGKPGQDAGRGLTDQVVVLRHLGTIRVSVVARDRDGHVVHKTFAVRLRYPSLLVGQPEDPPRDLLGCDPCTLTDPAGDALSGADVDWASSRHVGSRVIQTIHVRNSLSAGGANVCLFLGVHQPHHGYSAGCSGPKINDGMRDFGPVQVATPDSHTLVISFSARQIGNPTAYYWRVWTHAGDHLTYDLAPSAPGHGGPVRGRMVKQQLRFSVGSPP